MKDGPGGDLGVVIFLTLFFAVAAAYVVAR